MPHTPARRILRSTVASKAVLCSLLAGLAVGLAGCEDSSSNYAQQLEDARDTMMMLSTSSENRESEIEQVIAKLNTAMRSVEGDTKAPAQLMIASANAQLAELKMSAARQLAAQINFDLTTGDAVAREYSNDRAFARMLVGPDAAVSAREIEQEIRTVDAEIRSLQTQRESLASDLADVNAQIQQLMQSARAERLQEADLRDEAINAEPMRRSELIAEAIAHSRAAESYEKSAAERELTVNSLELAIDQVDQMIQNQQAIRAIHTQGLERITQVDTATNQRRNERTEIASESLSSYRAKLEAVLGQFRGEFAEVSQAAAEGYASAASTAQQARSMGSLATTAAGEHAADAARAYELHAQTARRIASSAVYLVNIDATNRSYYQGIVDEFEGIAAEAESKAAEYFSQAASSLSSADDRLSENYESRARGLRGEPDPAPADDLGETGDETGSEDPMMPGE